jgi:hypothetical protein
MVNAFRLKWFVECMIKLPRKYLLMIILLSIYIAIISR